MPKTQFLVPQLKYKFAPTPKLHPWSDHIINTHTDQVKTLRMTTSIPVYKPKHKNLTSKTVIWLCWLSRKIRHTTTQTNQNWNQFQKAQLSPYKNKYTFSHSPPGQGVMPTNLLPLEWNQVTHSPVSFLQYLCQTTVWWYPSSRMALCLSSTLTNIQAHSGKLCTHK